MNERGCWTTKEETDTHAFDESLTKGIISLFPNATIVDIGCGNGAYTKYLKDNGFSCDGFDGSPLTIELSNGLCRVLDFSVPQYIGEYDLVLCLEVGEHIPAEYEKIFLNNLCRTSNNWICLSWAVEGQGGTGHVNCRDNWYVTNEMRKRYFEVDTDKTILLRQSCTLPWFKNTIMVFYRRFPSLYMDDYE